MTVIKNEEDALPSIKNAPLRRIKEYYLTEALLSERKYIQYICQRQKLCSNIQIGSKTCLKSIYVIEKNYCKLV